MVLFSAGLSRNQILSSPASHIKYELENSYKRFQFCYYLTQSLQYCTFINKWNSTLIMLLNTHTVRSVWMNTGKFTDRYNRSVVINMGDTFLEGEKYAKCSLIAL